MKCVLVWYSQPLTSTFGLVNSSIKKMRLKCRLHPSHSMTGIVSSSPIRFLHWKLRVNWSLFTSHFSNRVKRRLFCVRLSQNWSVIQSGLVSHSSLVSHSVSQFIKQKYQERFNEDKGQQDLAPMFKFIWSSLIKSSNMISKYQECFYLKCFIFIKTSLKLYFSISQINVSEGWTLKIKRSFLLISKQRVLASETWCELFGFSSMLIINVCRL